MSSNNNNNSDIYRNDEFVLKEDNYDNYNDKNNSYNIIRGEKNNSGEVAKEIMKLIVNKFDDAISKTSTKISVQLKYLIKKLSQESSSQEYLVICL